MTSADRNVFILSADSLRADVLNERTQRLAELISGVNFTNAVATGSATAHSVPTLACGEYKHEIGPTLSEEDSVTFAERLSREGFASHLWTDNGILGPERGFNRGFSNEEDEGTGESWEQQFRSIVSRTNSEYLFRFSRWTYFNIIKPLQETVSSNGGYYKSADTWHESVRDQLQSGPDTGQFHWVHYMDTHHPFEPPSEYLDKYSFSGKSSRSRLSELSSKAIISNMGTGISESDLSDIWKAYCASCEFWYDSVEEFIGYLLDTGYYQPDRDVMIITSDHGEGFDRERHGMIGHTPTPAFWEDLVRVPLIMSVPGWESSTVNSQVSLIDVYPTILRNIGYEIPDSASGVGAETPGAMQRKYAVFSAKGPEKYFFGIRREDGWKLFADRIRTQEGVSFTMDQREGNQERLLLTSFASEEYSEGIEHECSLVKPEAPPSNLREVWDDLESALNEFAGGVTSDSSEELSEELKDQLRDLGYVDDLPD